MIFTQNSTVDWKYPYGEAVFLPVLLPKIYLLLHMFCISNCVFNIKVEVTKKTQDFKLCKKIW